MDKTNQSRNRDGRWAPIANLALGARAMERVMNRAPHLPGIAVVYAPYGSGKSWTETYCLNEYGGVFVECQSYFTRKNFVQKVLEELQVGNPGRTVGEMMEQIADQLEKSERPLILDDVHRITHSSVLGLILDLHNMCKATMMLAGDEGFPAALHRADGQLSSRVLVCQKLKPLSIEDAGKLAKFYCVDDDSRPISISDDLLAHFTNGTRHNARLLCINLEHAREYCTKNGLRAIDLKGWGGRGVYTGDTPKGGA